MQRSSFIMTTNSSNAVVTILKQNAVRQLSELAEKGTLEMEWTDSRSNTLLHVAAEFNASECLKLLIKHCKDTKAVDVALKANMYGENVMHTCARNMNLDLLMFLVKELPDLIGSADKNNKLPLENIAIKKPRYTATPPRRGVGSL